MLWSSAEDIEARGFFLLERWGGGLVGGLGDAVGWGGFVDEDGDGDGGRVMGFAGGGMFFGVCISRDE